MITELKVENFKSFGSGAPPLSLRRLNFIVGANASGKTNLISALRFLKSALLGNVESAAAEFGGPKQIRNNTSARRTSVAPLRIGLKIERVAISVGFKEARTIRSMEYDVTVDFRRGSGLPIVLSECFQAQVKGRGVTGPFKLNRTRRHVRFDDPAFGPPRHREFEIPEQDEIRLVAGTGFFSRPCTAFRNHLEGWNFFHIDADQARAPAKEMAKICLGPAGEHLPAVLRKIEQQNGNGGMSAIISGLRGAVPNFKTIRTRRLPVEGSWVFQVVEDRIRGAIDPRCVSDGTIRLLALMVIATWSSRQSTLLTIEEPENGLHPHLSKHVVATLRETARRGQVLVTTHNPDFLDELEPEEVILCDKEDGFTVVRHASDVAEIKSFRKHYRLGELWEQGTLGGIP